MKKHHYILFLLFTLLNSLVVFANTNDSMSVKPVHEKDSTHIKQKTVTKRVHTDLANLEEAVRKLSGQNSNAGMLPASTKQFRSFPSLDTYTTNITSGNNDDLAEFNEANLEKWFGKNANANKNLTETDRQTEDFKKFWMQHESNVTKYLEKTHGLTNVGRQITVDIKIKGIEKTISCRLDNLIKVGKDRFQIIDAKSSIKNNLSKVELSNLTTNLCTTNQKAFYKALKDNKIEKITPRGKRAIDYFNEIEIDLPENLKIEKTIDFYVNDKATEGYSIFKTIY